MEKQTGKWLPKNPKAKKQPLFEDSDSETVLYAAGKAGKDQQHRIKCTVKKGPLAKIKRTSSSDAPFPKIQRTTSSHAPSTSAASSRRTSAPPSRTAPRPTSPDLFHIGSEGLPDLNVPPTTPGHDMETEQLTQTIVDTEEDSVRIIPPPEEQQQAESQSTQEEPDPEESPLTQQSARGDSTTEEADSDDPRARHISLTREVERDLGEWLQANPFLYDRALPDYKNSAKKKRTLHAKGQSLQPPLTGDQLKRWIHTKRTKYGRLTKKGQKSGSAATQLTALDKWTLDLFQFMAPHIVRQKDTKSLGTSQVCQVLF